MKYVIEDNVPLMERSQGENSELIHSVRVTFHELEENQSFVVPFGEIPPAKLTQMISTRLSYTAKKANKNVMVRKVSEGVRVWRLPNSKSA